MSTEVFTDVQGKALEALEAYRKAKRHYDLAYEEKRKAEQRLLGFFPEGADVIRVGTLAVKRERLGSLTVLKLAEPVVPQEEAE